MFRFTIRDILWLTVVVALAISLWTQHAATTLWQSRASVAAKALDDADRQNAWHQSGIVVTMPAPSTNVPILKVYRGH